MPKRAYKALLAEQHAKDSEELRRAEGNSALLSSMRELFSLRDQIYRESRVTGPVRRLARATAEAAEALKAGDRLVERRRESSAKALAEHQAFLRRGVDRAAESERHKAALIAASAPRAPVAVVRAPVAETKEEKHPKPPKSLEEALLTVNKKRHASIADKKEQRAAVRQEYAERYGIVDYDRDWVAKRSKGTPAKEVRKGEGAGSDSGSQLPDHERWMDLLSLALQRPAHHGGAHFSTQPVPSIMHFH